MTTSSSAFSVVNFSVPRVMKNAWVQRSQALSMKLTDWVCMVLNREIENPFSFYPMPKRSDASVLIEPLVMSLGWSLTELASFLDVSLEDASAFIRGEKVRSISPAVFDLLLLLANKHPDLKVSPKFEMVDRVNAAALPGSTPASNVAKPNFGLGYSASGICR